MVRGRHWHEPKFEKGKWSQLDVAGKWLLRIPDESKPIFELDSQLKASASANQWQSLGTIFSWRMGITPGPVSNPNPIMEALIKPRWFDHETEMIYRIQDIITGKIDLDGKEFEPTWDGTQWTLTSTALWRCWHKDRKLYIDFDRRLFISALLWDALRTVIEWRMGDRT